MVSIKLVLVIFFAIAIAGTIGFFLIKNTFAPMEISKTELSNGTSILLKEKETVKFNLDNEEHKMTIDSSSENYINVTIQSEIIKARINVGQTRRFDLNNDSEEDFLVRLNNVTDGKADLYIKKFVICFENWTCDNWTACINSNQTRECIDISNCGTEEIKPKEIQKCFPSCSAQSGILCGGTEICNGTAVDASDGNCCVGICETKPPEDCGTNINCLISSSQNCNIAILNHSVESNNGTWIQTIVYYYKIRGFENEKCKLYQEIIEISGSFTESEEQALISSGKTQEEVDLLEMDVNDMLGNELIGKSGICRFSTYSLDEYLTAVKDENYELTAEDIENYGCTGDLYA